MDIKGNRLLEIIAALLYVFGVGAIFPSMFQYLYGKTKRALILTAIYWFVLTPLAWLLFFMIIGLCIDLPLYLAFFVVVLYDAHQIAKGNNGLFPQFD